MNRKRSSPRNFASLSADAGPDDGREPRQYIHGGGRQRQAHRKMLQLCGQIGDTLNLALAGDSGDDVLSELQVISVVPAPDASQLLVVVAPKLAGGPDEKQVHAALADAADRLRAEVAAAITRRRAPKLLFQFVNCPLTRT